MPSSKRSFVLLRHEHPRGTHWDLCLDVGHTLATWQIQQDPALLKKQAPDRPSQLDARRLPDHRRVYLDYEGPISGNRGHVTRVDKGTWTCLNQDADGLSVQLHGELLQGQFRIEKTESEENAWTVYRL